MASRSPQLSHATRRRRVLAFSDWRTQPIAEIFEFIAAYGDKFTAEIDLIVYAGDDVRRFRDGNANYFSHLALRTSSKKVLVVRGNDGTAEDREILEGNGIVDLHRQSFRFGGYRFIGQEGATLPPGSLIYGEEEVERRLRRRLTDEPTILVSHTPPFGLLDSSVRFGISNTGSTAVRRLVDERKLQMVICGHSHQNGGHHLVRNGCTVLNIASNDRTDSVGRICVFDLGIPLSEDCFFDTTSTQPDSPLLKLQQVGFNRLAYFHEAGITSLEQITEENRPWISRIPYVYPALVDLWIKHARALRSKTPVVDTDLADRLISSRYVVYDVATDLSQTRVCIIGCYVSSTREYRQFFHKNCHATLIREFLDFLSEYRDHRLVSYSNNRLDQKALRRLLAGAGLSSTALESELDLGMHVQKLLLGEFPYSLTALAEAVGFRRRSPLDGYQVGALYSNYLSLGIEPDWDCILQHNRERVEQTKHIIDVIKSGSITAN